ncbi:MAG: EAL domain-containing protein [Sphingomonadales bacterium]|nr:EAL domain-containing protein [Sphingomonadales bacterium]MDE2171841.1 EAL domain-containing protein [Sphingomonadales bacterium]
MRALAEYQINPAQGLPALAPIVDMAARLFDCSGAAVNMIGDTSVTLIASQGIGQCDLSRDLSFCAHAINQDGVFLVADATTDARFHDNPLVRGGFIRFYAGVPLRAPSGHALGALCVVDEQPRKGFAIMDRQRLIQLAEMAADKLELRRLEVASVARRFSASAIPSPSAIISCDGDGQVTGCNAAAAELLGWSMMDLSAAPIEMVFAPADRAQIRDSIARLLTGAMPMTEGDVLMAQRRDGGFNPVELHWSSWTEDGRSQVGLILRNANADQSERDALYRLANFDAVTGLPNRNLLWRHLEESFAARRAFSMILITLEGFADVNNTLGRTLGDRVLRHVAQRLRSALPHATLIARKGGVKFAALLPSRDPILLGAAARSIQSAIAVPLVLDGHDLHLASFAGMAIAPDHASCPDDLVGNAELALGQAASGGRETALLFLPQMRAQAIARRQMETELHHAFELGQFTLHFQPQVRLRDGHVTGAEALIRWQHPVHGLLMPAAFLTSLDNSVLAEAVGGWVLDRACAQLAQWRRFHSAFTISVNLSLAQLRRGHLPEIVAGLLREHDLPPECLELEITENIILDRHEDILAQLEQIRDSGVKLSFDDFGTGFASLNLLRNYPVSHIKIDKGFTCLVGTSAADRAIVKGVITMARDLGLEVTAEGVESQTIAVYLQGLGCDKGQGFFFGKPCSADCFAELYLNPTGLIASA